MNLDTNRKECDYRPHCPVISDDRQCILQSETATKELLAPLKRQGIHNLTIKQIKAVECEELRDRIAEIHYYDELITSDDYYSIIHMNYTLISPLDSHTKMPARIHNSKMKGSLK